VKSSLDSGGDGREGWAGALLDGAMLDACLAGHWRCDWQEGQSHCDTSKLLGREAHRDFNIVV